ncbi:hypothetical protein [Salana multivorans]
MTCGTFFGVGARPRSIRCAPSSLQTRLSRLSGEIRRCQAHRGFAAAHHTRAAVSAYETTLRQSLRHVGADDAVHPAGDIISLELDLAARGWQW